MNNEELKNKILELTSKYALAHHSTSLDNSCAKFIPGVTPIPYAGRVFGPEEVEAAVSTTLDFWLTLGEEGTKMEKLLAKTLGVRSSILCNSGSSANLLAVSALTSHELPEERRLKRGDEVITAAAGFPTTVSPIIQCGAVPVFIDNDPETGNPKTEMLEAAYKPGKTKAVIFAHALGNPFNISAVSAFCKKYTLWLIEDNCDALGSTYTVPSNHPLNLEGKVALTRATGTWGDLSTQSFYPAHHITMGEGGAVNIAGTIQLKRIVESLRDWGRDCWCQSGCDNTCGKRFMWTLGELPEGYDHKYIYSHLGYNLKPTDIQAAIGRVQLGRLAQFTEARIRNWHLIRSGLDDLSEFFSFTLPTHAIDWKDGSYLWDNSVYQSEPKCEPSWFGFMLRVKNCAPFTAQDLARHLDAHKIGNRKFFGGNLLRQPVFVELKRSQPESFRVVGDCQGADELMNTALFIGTYPGLNIQMIEYMVDVIRTFTNKS